MARSKNIFGILIKLILIFNLTHDLAQVADKKALNVILSAV